LHAVELRSTLAEGKESEEEAWNDSASAAVGLTDEQGGDSSSELTFAHVAVGGTFDHLHAGHRQVEVLLLLFFFSNMNDMLFTITKAAPVFRGLGATTLMHLYPALSRLSPSDSYWRRRLRLPLRLFGWALRATPCWQKRCTINPLPQSLT
jgi:hypothetical protein